MALDERDFTITTRRETTADLSALRAVNEYQMRVVRTKKDRIPPEPTSATDAVQAARLHDSRRRFGHVQDLRQLTFPSTRWCFAAGRELDTSDTSDARGNSEFLPRQ
jgi:hypothetical protein